MRRVALFWAALFLGAARLLHADGIPVETLKSLKAATVFVKVTYGPLRQTGSGFVIRKENDVGLIVTNDHVVSVPPELKARIRATNVVEAVFHSGRAKQEQTARAEVIATDADRDLAVLRVRGIKDLPEPIDLSQKPELIETATVYVLGFPFGEALAAGTRNPAITISKGSISSLRENDFGQLAVVQIDGEINPGNSGGPVVDAKGRLVGVAVAKVRGTGIGMAIPPMELMRMLEGRIHQFGIRVLKVADGVADVGVELTFIDPLNKVKDARVLVLPRSALKSPLRIGKDAKWPALPGAETVHLKMAGGKATGRFVVRTKEKEVIEYRIQPAYTNGSGRLIHVAPSPARVDLRSTKPKSPMPNPPSAPSPKKGDSSGIPDETEAVDDLKIVHLSLGDGKSPPCLCWSDDGDAFFHIDQKTGTVRRVSFPGFEIEARLETERKCQWCGPWTEGLALAVTSPNEVWLLNGEDLKVTRRISTSSFFVKLLTSRKSEFAYGAGYSALTVIDLKRGKEIEKYQTSQLYRRSKTYTAALTPDGKYLFAEGGTEQLVRFKVNGPKIQFEEATDRLIQGRFQGICISADGKYVCAPSGRGNYYLKNQEAAGYGTYVFRAADLRKPALVIGGGQPHTGFDGVTGRFFSKLRGEPLLVFNQHGLKIGEYRIYSGSAGKRDYRFHRGECTQVLVHPDGGKLLLLWTDLSTNSTKGENSEVSYVEYTSPASQRRGQK